MCQHLPHSFPGPPQALFDVSTHWDVQGFNLCPPIAPLPKLPPLFILIPDFPWVMDDLVKLPLFLMLLNAGSHLLSEERYGDS